jgi:hypothetical protein
MWKKKLTTTTEIKHQEQVRASLECPMQRYYKGMLQSGQNPLLSYDALQPLLLLEEPRLAHNFHGAHLSSRLVHRLNHAPRTTNTYYANDLEILNLVSWL